ncbi:MAG: sugar O-acetyltransferase [Elusimicrobiaceae bacterium]|nr:sugar O-acetyltransferase [Elusimicrobiaceae bacterium]
MEMGTELLQAFAEYAEEARQITMEMNNHYHTFAEVRELFSKLTASKIDESCILVPPFYTEFGKNTKLGKNIFINACCRFQDNGGIEIGDGSLIGQGVTIVTLNHDLNPKTRHDAAPKPVKIGKNVWIGASCTILPGVTIADNAVIGAGSIVVKSVPENAVAVGNPARVIKYITEDKIH